MITAAQCRAARALLKWKQEELAQRADVGVSTIRTYEVEKTAPHRSTLKAIQTAFESAGVEFLSEGKDPIVPGGEGVRLRNQQHHNA